MTSNGSLDIWADLEEIFSLPFGVGEKMQEAGQSLPRARQGDDLEYFLPPIARPKVNKSYFRKPSFRAKRNTLQRWEGENRGLFSCL